MLRLNIAVANESLFHKWERIVGKKPDRTVQDIVNVLMRGEMRPHVAELIEQYDLYDQLLACREELTSPENQYMYIGTLSDERELREETATVIELFPWEGELDQQEELDFECCSYNFTKSNPSRYDTWR